MSIITAEYVLNKFDTFKSEILQTLREEMKTCVSNEFAKFRQEMDAKFEEHTKSRELMEQQLNTKSDELEGKLNERMDVQEIKLHSIMEKIEGMLNRQVEMEDRGRRLNLVISGIEADQNSTCQEVAENFFINKLKIDRTTVDTFLYRNIHYIGAEKPGKGRSLIVAFVRQTDRDMVFSCGNKLKGSSISLKPNYSPETRAVRDRLMKKRLELKSSELNVRLVERKYKPELQVQGQNGRWSKYDVSDGDADDDEYF